MGEKDEQFSDPISKADRSLLSACHGAAYEGFHDSACKQQIELMSELVRTGRLGGLLNVLHSFEILLVVTKLF